MDNGDMIIEFVLKRSTLLLFALACLFFGSVASAGPPQAAEKLPVSCPKATPVIDDIFSHNVVSCPKATPVIDEIYSNYTVPDAGTGCDVTFTSLVFTSDRTTYYLRDSTRPKIPLPCELDGFFCVNDLLVVSACEGGSGGCYGSLFLLKVTDKGLRLLDVWQSPYVGDLDYSLHLQAHSLKRAAEGALFRIELEHLGFSFFVKASHEGLSPVFDPSVYKPFCKKTDKLPLTDAGRLRQSCVCTYLLEPDKEKARRESRAKIERYYRALMAKAQTFPDRLMTYEQYQEYLLPRLGRDWRYKAIADAHEGSFATSNGRPDLVKALEYVQKDNIEKTMKIFDNFSHMRDAFHPEGAVSLETCE